ncbi:MAG: hypothetical protein HY657_20410 [Acidobacteria bacterium]|nr:hypothetical protein [Acidobacteriota bacterium]
MRIVSQRIPESNDDQYERGLADARRGLLRAVAARVSASDAFADRERAVLAAANEACRRLLEADLHTTAEGHPDRVQIEGVEYARHHEGTVTYHSLCGPLTVRRATYREVGVHNGPTVVPLERAAGLIEGATPALAYRVALGAAQGPGRHAEEQMHADHREPPSRSTLERLATAIGTAVTRTAPRIEPLVRERETLPERARGVSVGLDRTTVPMEEERPAGVPPDTRRQRRTTPYVRAVPPRVDVKYRMAYVGTVSVVDAAGEALVTRRYAITGDDEPADLVTRMMADVQRARAQAPRVRVGVIQDAAPELWTLLRDGFRTDARLRHWEEGIDRYHLNERLAEILRITEPDAARRTQQLARWNDALDRDDATIDRIARWLAARISAYEGDDLATLEAHWTFLCKNNDRLRYATLRANGLPCGSGATDGACKSVVMIRAKGCGQRWHQEGVTAVLTLRSAYLSERLDTLWPHFADDYSAEIQAAA